MTHPYRELYIPPLPSRPGLEWCLRCEYWVKEVEDCIHDDSPPRCRGPYLIPAYIDRAERRDMP